MLAADLPEALRNAWGLAAQDTGYLLTGRHKKIERKWQAMLFNSFDFIIFFLTVVPLYFMLPKRFRWGLLLIASYFFYGYWRIEYLLLIVISTLVDYWAGLRMGHYSSQQERKPYLIISIAVNLGILCLFKYADFLYNTVITLCNSGAAFPASPFNIALPVGISFYTFQTMAYTIDVYRGKQIPEKHLGIFALYVSFFPQLVAGPVERAGNLLPQFRKKYSLDYDRITSGLKLILWGFFKKLVIADRLAVFISAVHDAPQNYSLAALIMNIYFGSIMVYCDFSGYTDIARGTARVLGFELMENFKQPFFSTSLAEFWRKWHISISSWFQDYLYKPLLKKRHHSRKQAYLNLILLFLIIGLWHGANWKFVIWGGINGVFLAAGSMTRKFRNQIWHHIETYVEHKTSGFPASLNTRRIRRILAMFTVNTLLSSVIFFLTDSVTSALIFYKQILLSITTGELLGRFPISRYELGIALISILLLWWVDFLDNRISIRRFLAQRPVYVRWTLYYAVGVLILIWGEFNLNEFVYFQF